MAEQQNLGDEATSADPEENDHKQSELDFDMRNMELLFDSCRNTAKCEESDDSENVLLIKSLDWSSIEINNASSAISSLETSDRKSILIQGSKTSEESSSGEKQVESERKRRVHLDKRNTIGSSISSTKQKSTLHKKKVSPIVTPERETLLSVSTLRTGSESAVLAPPQPTLIRGSRRVVLPEPELGQAIQWYRKFLRYRLNTLRLEGRLCDMTIQVSDESFKAHRLIMAFGNDMFSQYLTSDGERNEDCKKRGADNKVRHITVNFPEVTGQTFEKLIEFIYLQSFSGLRLLSVNQLKELHDGIQMIGLHGVDLFGSYVVKYITAENFVELWDVADDMCNKKLESALVQFVIKHFDTLWMSLDLLTLARQKFELILAFAHKTPELQDFLLRALLGWVKQDIFVRRPSFPVLASYIRLSDLSESYIKFLLHEDSFVQENKVFRKLLQRSLDDRIRSFFLPVQHHSAKDSLSVATWTRPEVPSLPSTETKPLRGPYRTLVRKVPTEPAAAGAIPKRDWKKTTNFIFPAVASSSNDSFSLSLGQVDTTVTEESVNQTETTELDEEKASANQKRIDEEKDSATQKRIDEEKDSANQKRIDEEKDSANRKRIDEEKDSATQKRIDEEKDSANQKRIDEEKDSENQKRIDEEKDSANRKRIDEEKDSATQKRIDEEKDSANQKRIDEEKDSENQKRINEEKDSANRKRIDEEKDSANRKRMDEEKASANQKRIDKRKPSANQKRIDEEKASANKKRIDEEKQSANWKRIIDPKDSPNQKRIDEEKDSATQKRIDEEKDSANQKRIDEEKDSANRKRIDEEKDSATQKRIDEEKDSANQKRIDEEKDSENQKRIDEEKDSANRKRIDEEKDSATQKRIDEEKDSANQKRIDEEKDSENQKRINEEKDSANRKRIDEEKDSANRKRMDEEKASANQKRIDKRKPSANQKRIDEEKASANKKRIDEEKQSANWKRIIDPKDSPKQKRIDKEKASCASDKSSSTPFALNSPNNLLITGKDLRTHDILLIVYSPDDGSYMEIENLGPRSEDKQTIVTVAKRMFFIGGEDESGKTKLDCVYVYNFDTKSFVRLKAMHLPRIHPISFVTGNTLYVCGGTGEYAKAISQGESLDLSNDKAIWKVMAPMKAGRAEKASSCRSSKMIYVVGGSTNRCEFFDGKNKVWQELAPLPDDFDKLQPFVVIVENKLIAFNYYRPTKMFLLDSDRGSWKAVPIRGEPPVTIISAATVNGSIYVIDTTQKVYSFEELKPRWKFELKILKTHFAPLCISTLKTLKLFKY